MHDAVVRRLTDIVRSQWLVALILLVILTVGFLLWIAFAVPSWLVDTHGMTGADLAKTRNDFRATVLTAVGGLTLIAGAVVGGLSLVHNYRALDETQRQNRAIAEHGHAILELQRRGQVTERFSKAIEQLGSGEPGVRIGAWSWYCNAD